MNSERRIDPITHQQVVRHQADHHPLVNDRTFASIEGYVGHLIHLRAYEEVSRLAAGKRVLDVGCNVGYGVEILLSTALSAAGIDVSPKAIGVARRRLEMRADIRLYDGVRSDFAPHSFEVVTSFQVIEHVADYSIYFAEITRLLCKDGLAVFTTPNACLRLDPGMKPWNKFHVREFRPHELRELLHERFDVVDIRGLFGTNEIYEIERQRLERARAAARLPARQSGAVFRAAVRRWFPWAVQVRNGMRAHAKRGRAIQTLDRALLDRFGTCDLFYSGESLEQCLDLMALCRAPKC